MNLISHTIIELAIISALLSLFLNFCYREGHLLGWWLDVWAKLFLVIESKEEMEIPDGVNERDYKFSQIESRAFKPLGYCVVCQNAWISGLIGCFTGNILHTALIILLSSFIVRITHERLL